MEQRNYQGLPDSILGENNPTSPIFIVGVHRSGNTLLRYMLSSHSHIYIPPETDFIPFFFEKKPHEELSDTRIEKLLRIIFTRYRFVENWQGERPITQEFIKAMPARTPAAFLDTLYGQYAIQNGAVRWGDKTPIYASYVDLIHEIFPKAQFIHIIRDPRDAALSLLEKYETDEFHIDIYFAARNWVRRIRHIQASGEKLGPALFYELRYENLVKNPEKELKKVCGFIGETYSSDMLQQQNLASDQIPPNSHFFDNVRKPIFTTSVGKWRNQMSLPDQRLIQHITGDLLTELSYPINDLGNMNRREIIRLIFLQAKYEFLQAGRRVLQTIGLVPPI